MILISGASVVLGKAGKTPNRCVFLSQLVNFLAPFALTLGLRIGISCRKTHEISKGLGLVWQPMFQAAVCLFFFFFSLFVFACSHSLLTWRLAISGDLKRYLFVDLGVWAE